MNGKLLACPSAEQEEGFDYESGYDDGLDGNDPKPMLRGCFSTDQKNAYMLGYNDARRQKGLSVVDKETSETR